MPTPARTSLDAIVRAGRDVLEADGLEGLTMSRVAGAVGVRPPSLYKHVAGRGALVRQIAQAAFEELGATLERAASSGDPAADLRAIALAFRSFAHAQPRTYALLFGALPDAWRPAPDAYQPSLAVLFRVVSGLVGPERQLEAARTLVAWSHGFVSMELAGAFQLGGDVDDAFSYGIEALSSALTAPAA
jgi:AcrR family transcriptional regulator